MTLFADVILPVPLADTYTYRVPEAFQLQVGMRVVVPLGTRKIYTGIVYRVHEECPEGYKIKDVLDVLDRRPLLNSVQLKLWRWVADYYMCTLGEVYKAAVPSGMKLEGETVVTLSAPDDVLTRASEEADLALTPSQERILDTLRLQKALSISSLQKQTGIKSILPQVRRLMDQNLVQVSEEVRERVKPRKEVYVTLAPFYRNAVALGQVLGSLKSAPKQRILLVQFLALTRWDEVVDKNDEGLEMKISRKELLTKTGIQPSIFLELVRKGILESYEEEPAFQEHGSASLRPLHDLSEAQQASLDAIRQSFEEKPVCLLHGVTSSGKTEVYIHLIQNYLLEGKQVLFLLPEIILTTQLTERLRKVFGDRLGVYHSKFTDSMRAELWRKQNSEHPYDVIVGVRSSVFLPFRNLGLVIVDEEHEPSFKQQDPAPRYHARNVALMLASYYGCHTLLGTATPSFESYYHARTGKYGLVNLHTRYSDVPLPDVEIVDIRTLQKKKMMKGIFSPVLYDAIRQALEEKEQVILFQNRRGYAPVLTCKTCGWVPRCVHCDVSLTYHHRLNQLTCHYCGFTVPLPSKCPACEETVFLRQGIGTERIEAELHEQFPEARVARMDLDTTRTRAAYEKILSDFEQGHTDILIGTQMVSKGLDFERVRVVGIIDADQMLHLPDFRSYERSFQMMAQVAGRAGRRTVRGKVFLQTRNPELPVVSQVVSHDFLAHYQSQMLERQMFHYPPFCQLIYIYLKHKDEAVLERASRYLGQTMRQVFGDRVLGPDAPPVGRVQTLYIRKVILKIEKTASLSKVRELLWQQRTHLLQQTPFHAVQFYFDVDPL